MAERYVGRRRAPGRHRAREPRGPIGALWLLAALGVTGCAAAVLQAYPFGSPAAAPAKQTSAGLGAPTSGQVVSAASGMGSTALTPSSVIGQLPATALRMTAVSRQQERPALRRCDGQADRSGYSNGQIPTSELCELPFEPGQRLRADAASSLALLDEAYVRVFGDDVCVSDSYRSLRSQQSLRGRKPRLAARAGTSEHGWGVAVDLCSAAGSIGTREHDWLLANARRFGWDNPAWARANGSKPEPWHWEYVAGQG